VRDGGVDEPRGGEEGKPKSALPVLVTQLGEVPGPRSTGIRDHDIERAKGPRRFLDHALALALLLEIGTERECLDAELLGNRPGRLLQRSRAARDQGDANSLGRQSPGAGQADAFRRSPDYGRPVLDSKIHAASRGKAYGQLSHAASAR